MANFMDELGAYLIAQGVVTALNTDLFLGYLPDYPDPCLAIRPTSGRPPVKHMGDAAIRYERPTAQVVTRGVQDDFQTPFALATSAHAALVKIEAGLAAGTLSGTKYNSVEALQQPTPLGPDEKGRHRIVFNIAIEKEPS